MGHQVQQFGFVHHDLRYKRSRSEIHRNRRNKREDAFSPRRGERSKRKESVSPERMTRRSRSVVPGKEPFVLGILKKRSQSQCTRRKRSHSVSFLGVEVKEEYLGEVESYTQDDYLDEYMKTRGITVTVNDSKEEWIKPI